MNDARAEPEDDLEERALLLIRGRRNGLLTEKILRRAGIRAVTCVGVGDLCAKIREGAGTALVMEECLTKEAVRELRETFDGQPVWSDFPIVVFSATGDSRCQEGLSRQLGNVIFLDRPIRTRSMIASIESALRSRHRQYAGRREIEARDTFLAMLGHELRNPLGAIGLAVDALSHRPDDKAQPQRFEIIARQSKHLVRLVDDLLDVARVTRGKLTLQSERLDLGEIVRQAFEVQAEKARERDHTYELDAPDGLLIDGDRERLEQVFANLLSNAIKYTPRGGKIRMVVHGSGDEARVSVSDTGIGLAPAMLDKVFEVFAQAERSLARSEGGLGLGLAVVQTLVKLHGGRVHAESDGPGRGTTFVVDLPLAVAKELSPSQAPPKPSPVAPQRVVVIDDNADLRDLLAEILGQAGHEVTCAEDGPTGLAAILSNPPDIAFVDLGIPGFDGLELARRVRAAGSNVRLVAVTGYGQGRDRERSLEVGFEAHLTKPVTDDDLHRAMQMNVGA